MKQPQLVLLGFTLYNADCSRDEKTDVKSYDQAYQSLLNHIPTERINSCSHSVLLFYVC